MDCIAAAIEKILDKIKKLSPAERNKLCIILEAEEINDEDIDVSKQAAGGWADINADKLIEEI